MSMPRIVIPCALMESSKPQIFSRGLWRLAITIERRVSSLPTFHHRSDSLSAANAKRGQSEMSVLILHRMQERSEYSRAAGSDRMPQRDGAAPHVYLFRIQLEFGQYRE